MGLDEFDACLKDAVKSFGRIGRKETIRIVSHLDTDGICAAAILIKALSNENYRYSITIVPQLDARVLEELSLEDYKHYVFTDLGSGQINHIARILSGKDVFIIDHHEPASTDGFEGIVHVNPHLYGINGSREISGSGVVYMFAKAMSSRNSDSAHIAVIGAIGDNQENMGFNGINSMILDDAVRSGKMVVKNSLRLFGAQTKPLHKLLEYSYSPYIPGVTGSESGAIEFLKSMGINPRVGNTWKKFVHLTDDELRRLTEGIIISRAGEKSPDKILGPVYTLPDEKEGPLRDAREFSTLLNACGRMGKASIGIGVCLGDEKSKIRAQGILKDYRSEIVSALKWFEDSGSSPDIIRERGYLIINAKNSIMPTIAGTVASIICNSDYIEKGTYVVSMARTDDRKTKISFRVSGAKGIPGVDLTGIAQEIISSLGTGEAGGHKRAAGAIIPSSEEKGFIGHARRVLEKLSMEECINVK